MQVTWLDIVLALIALLSAYLNLRGYVWKREADIQLTQVKQTADDAKLRAESTADLAGAIKTLAESVTESSQKAAEERDGWHKTITDTLETHRQFGVVLGQVKEAVHTVNEGVSSLSNSIIEGRNNAVKEVKDQMAASDKTTDERMTALERDVAAIKQMVTEMYEEHHTSKTAATGEGIGTVAGSPPSTEPPNSGEPSSRT